VEVQQEFHPEMGEKLPENEEDKNWKWRRFRITQVPWGSGIFLADLNTGIVYSDGTVGDNYDSSG